MKNPNLVCCVLCIAAFAVAGCWGDSQNRTDGVVVSDSAGVLSTQIPSMDGLQVPSWRLDDEYNTMTPPAALDLYQVAGARFLRDGNLAIANSGTHEILVLTSDGRLEHRIGGQGEGPGEFNTISAMDVDRAGDLWAYDPRMARLTRVAPDGTVLETRRLTPANSAVDLQPLALLDDGGVLAVYGQIRVFTRGGESRDTTPLFRFDSTDTVVDTLGMWPGQEWSYLNMSSGVARVLVGFGRKLAYAGRSGRSVLGSTDSLNLAIYDRNARLAMRITGGGPNPEVSPAMLAEWKQKMASQVSKASPAIQQAFADAPYRATVPAFESLLVDDSGRVWVGGYVAPGQSERRWVVVGTDGHLEGQLEVPARARLLDVAEGRIAILRWNDVDEEYVVVSRVLSM